MRHVPAFLLPLFTKCVEKVKFYADRGYNRAPIWAQRLVLAPITSTARAVKGLVGSICSEEMLRTVTTCYGQLPRGFPKRSTYLTRKENSLLSRPMGSAYNTLRRARSLQGCLRGAGGG